MLRSMTKKRARMGKDAHAGDNGNVQNNENNGAWEDGGHAEEEMRGRVDGLDAVRAVNIVQRASNGLNMNWQCA